VVIWLDDSSKSSLFTGANGNSRDPNRSQAPYRPKPHIRRLLDSGATVVGADLLYQGEFLKDGEPIEQTRVVANPREAPAYTFGYNHSLFAQRTHDILTLVRFVRTAKVNSLPSPSSVAIAAFGHTGPVAAAARAVSGNAIDAAAIDTRGFRFANVRDYRDPMFLPGGAKYGDLPGLLALGAPGRLWVTGEETLRGIIAENHRKQPKELTIFNSEPSRKQFAAAKWLLQ
jgi:hypothetical protein